jgi:hypothetical protein
MPFSRLLPLLLLAACMPAEPDVAVDQCILKGYLEECGGEELTPEEKASCQRRAPAEATRVRAAVPPRCRLL